MILPKLLCTPTEVQTYVPIPRANQHISTSTSPKELTLKHLRARNDEWVEVVEVVVLCVEKLHDLVTGGLLEDVGFASSRRFIAVQVLAFDQNTIGRHHVSRLKMKNFSDENLIHIDHERSA